MVTTDNIYGSLVPVGEDLANTDDLTLGTLFTCAKNGLVTGFRWYCPSVAPSLAVTGALYRFNTDTVAGPQLGFQVAFSSLTTSGWNTATLAAPTAIDAGTRYIAVVWTPDRYAFTSLLFQSAGITNGQLTAPKDDAVTPAHNGRFRDPSVGGPAYPASSFNSTGYFADISVQTEVQTIFKENGSTPSSTFTDGPYTLGTVFTSDVDGQVLGIRWYVPGSVPTGSLVGLLYSWSSNTTGTELARATFAAGASANGWHAVLFSSPVNITAGTKYVAAVCTQDRYGATTGFFTGHAETNSHLTAPANGTTTQGKFHAGGTPAYPDSGTAASYFADVLFAPSTGGVATVGAGALGLTATVTDAKVAKVTGLSALGLTAAGTDRKVAAKTGAAAFGLTATGTDRKVAPQTGISAAGLAELGADAKRATPAGLTSALGLSAAAGEATRQVDSGTTAMGLTASGAVVKHAPVTGSSSLGLDGESLHSVPRPVTGRVFVALAATGTTARTAVSGGSAALGLSTTASMAESVAVTGRAAVGLAAAGPVGTRRSVTLAAGAVGLSAAAAAVTRRPVTAASSAGLTAAAAVHVPGQGIPDLCATVQAVSWAATVVPQTYGCTVEVQCGLSAVVGTP